MVRDVEAGLEIRFCLIQVLSYIAWVHVFGVPWVVDFQAEGELERQVSHFFGLSYPELVGGYFLGADEKMVVAEESWRLGVWLDAQPSRDSGYDEKNGIAGHDELRLLVHKVGVHSAIERLESAGLLLLLLIFIPFIFFLLLVEDASHYDRGGEPGTDVLQVSLVDDHGRWKPSDDQDVIARDHDRRYTAESSNVPNCRGCAAREGRHSGERGGEHGACGTVVGPRETSLKGAADVGGLEGRLLESVRKDEDIVRSDAEDHEDARVHEVGHVGLLEDGMPDEETQGVADDNLEEATRGDEV
mmetsp:Transcript_31035/g.42031  ORF Transcript_31035/g.42031 Transcript_31035/m.42031 type:complete len:301 (+) Transcript_31035:1308-2210(+)